VDDDKADIGAGGPSHLQLSITGTGGLVNTEEWSIQTPYGPVKNVLLPYSGPASATNGDTLYNGISGVSNTTPIRITTPGQHHLSNGDTVVIDQVNGTTSANGTFKVGNATKTTFELFDLVTNNPIAGNGAYTPAPTPGRWSYPLHPYIDSGADLTKVFYRVTGDDALGTFQGTLVSANGVDRNKTTGVKFRIWQLGQQSTGRLLLDADLTDANGNALPAGTYTFTFGEVSGVGPTPTPTPTPAPTPDHRHEAYLNQLRVQLAHAKKISDPVRRWRMVQQLRDWIKIVDRGVDPDSRRGKLLRRLVSVRTIQDDARRRRLVEHIREELDNL
jgi:hypothetical protein